MSDAPPTVTELRIHGVGGGTPGDILGSEDYARIGVIGSDRVGFYRRTKPEGDPAREVEAYSWGGFSGRNFIRAFWIPLLPFAMVNVAGWMVNPDSGATSSAIQRAMVRLVAVAHTIMVVVWLGAIGVDVIGAEPAGHRVVFGALVPAVAVAVLVLASRRSELYESYPGQADGPGAPLRDDAIGPADPNFWRTGPFIRAQRHRHTTIATATIAALLGGWVWVVSGSTTAAVVAIVSLALISVEALLTALRVAVSTGVISTVAAIALALFAAVAAWSTTVDTVPDWPAATGSQPVFAEAPLWVLAGTGIVLVVLAVAEISGWIRRGRGVAIWKSGFPLWVARTVVAAIVVLLVVGVGWTSAMQWWSNIWWVRVGVLTGFGVALALILWIISRYFRRWILGALALIWIATVVSWLVFDNNRAWWWVGAAATVFFFAVASFAETGRRDRYRWLPATSTATLSLVPLTVTMAAVVTILNGWFGTAIALPTGYGWIIATFTGVVLIVLAGVVFHVLRRRLEVHRTGPIENEYPDADPDCRSTMAKKAALWRSLSDGLRDVDVVMTVVGGGIALILAAALVRVGRPELNLWSWERWHQGLFTSDFPSSWSYLAAAGTAIAVALPVLAFGLIVSTLVSPAMRSRVGVVWDVATFWPRRFHPLAPPAYSERAVPEIAGYVSELATERGVVVAAHSQGAVLLAAMLMQIADGANLKIAALTHGSPLGVYYRRFWPGTFGGGVYADLRQDLVITTNGATHQGWWNAFRLTDPIAEEVFSGPDERPGIVTDMRIPDPRWIDDSECPPTKVHSGYLGDPVVAAKMNELVTLVD